MRVGVEDRLFLVPFDGPFKAISAGQRHTCALYDDGAGSVLGIRWRRSDSRAIGNFHRNSRGL